MITLEVLDPGPLAVVEDLGRPGLAHVGVTRSGAADRRSRAGQPSGGQPEDRATVEITLGGFRARIHGGTVEVVVTGADATPAVDGIPFGVNSVRRLLPGQALSLATPATGLRSYLAVRGGIDVPAVLGSRSYDTLSGIGPPPLRTGDRIPVGAPGRGHPRLDGAPVAPIGTAALEVRVTPARATTGSSTPGRPGAHPVGDLRTQRPGGHPAGRGAAAPAVARAPNYPARARPAALSRSPAASR